MGRLFTARLEQHALDARLGARLALAPPDVGPLLDKASLGALP